MAEFQGTSSHQMCTATMRMEVVLWNARHATMQVRDANILGCSASRDQLKRELPTRALLLRRALGDEEHQASSGSNHARHRLPESCVEVVSKSQLSSDVVRPNPSTSIRPL